MDINWIDLIVTPLFGAGVGFAVWYFQSRIEKIRREKEKLHDERRKIYVSILEPFIRAFAGIKSPKESQKAIKMMASFDYKKTAVELNLYGSDKVVRAFNKMMQYIYIMGDEERGAEESAEMLRLWGTLLLEIRKNLGEENTKLSHREMLESQMKDIGKLLP